MTVFERIQSQQAIQRAADQQGITYEQCYSDISAAIDEAWATTDPAAKLRQNQLVGDSHKPTPEEFISLISEKLHKST